MYTHKHIYTCVRRTWKSRRTAAWPAAGIRRGYIYIYIYIYRERERYIYIYIYVLFIYLFIYLYSYFIIIVRSRLSDTTCLVHATDMYMYKHV